MGKPTIDRDKVFELLAELTIDEYPEEHWFTCDEAWSKTGSGMKKEAFRSRLDRLADKGVLKRHTIGRFVYYEWIEETNDKPNEIPPGL